MVACLNTTCCQRDKKKKKDSVKGGSRGHWSNHIEFQLTLIGYAVGLGNIWRFPYLCMRNGGGAFLIPYCVALALIGYPMFFLELAIGQFSGLSPARVWSIVPLFKGIGWSMALLVTIASCTYGYLMNLILYYLGMSFSKILPWTNCNNTWNTGNCFVRTTETVNTTATVPANTTGNSSYILSQVNSSSNASIESRVSPGEEFFRYNLLEITEGADVLGGLRWQLVLCHLTVWLIVGLCMIKGIKSTGKVVYVTCIGPYILLTILLIRGCILPGSMDGIIFYLKPDWSKLLEFRIWCEAAVQVFYSIGIFAGGNITYASYNKFHNNCHRDTYIVVTVNCLTSFYAGFAIFSVVGYMAHETGLPVEEVIKSGPGLAFIVYPEALSKLPLPQFWSVLFFLMLITLAIGTEIGHLQTVMACFTDAFPAQLKGKDRWVLLTHCIIGISVGLIFCTRGGMYWFQLIDWYGVAFSCLVSVLFGTLGISWLYGLRRIYKDIELMFGRGVCIGYKVFWGGLTPAYVLVVFVYVCMGFSKPSYGDYQYPEWAIAIAWVLPILCIVQLPIFAVVAFVKAKGTLLNRLRVLTKPNEHWKPQDVDYQEKYAYDYSGRKNTIQLDVANAQVDCFEANCDLKV